MELTTVEEITAAAERIAGTAVRTPLLPCGWADPDRPLWLKPENLQPIGAFKIRGAANAIARIPESARPRGVVAYSSGNHAQAVAYVAKLFGLPAAIVVPENTPAVKIAATRGYGAEVVVVPITDREIVAARLVAERGATLIPPFDHRDVIAGQGTIGLEVAADLPSVEVVLVPVSGGGLAAGVATAVKALLPSASVVGVEPLLAADAAASLAAGRLVRWSTQDRARTIADGLRAEPSELTFAHLHKLLDGIVTVTEEEIREAVAVLANRSHLVAEPSGAVTTAAYLHRAAELPRGRTVAIVSGGNINPSDLATILAT
ncbi:MAG TPA: threonine/serine dehydratase [Actinophytocola sp.]|nr:threonine/serine dehydratase [Actinophytocola sp.]